MNHNPRRSALSAAIGILVVAVLAWPPLMSSAQAQGYGVPTAAPAPQTQLSTAIQAQVARARAVQNRAVGYLAQPRAALPASASVPTSAVGAARQWAQRAQEATARTPQYVAQSARQLVPAGLQNGLQNGAQNALQFATGGATPVQPNAYAPAGYGLPAIGAIGGNATAAAPSGGMLLGPAASPYAQPAAASAYAQPTAPAYAQPAAPAYAQPTSPAYAQPAAPAYARPTAAYQESPALPNSVQAAVPLNVGQGVNVAMPGEPMYGQPLAAPALGGPMPDGFHGMVQQPMFPAGPIDQEPSYQAPQQFYQPSYQPSPTSGDIYNSLWTDAGNGWGSPQAVASDCGGGCRGLCSCNPCASRSWLRAEVLLGWLSGYRTPALLSQSPLGTPVDDYSDDRTIFGGRRFGRDLRIGGRLTGGYWFDECRKVGFHADAFSLGNDDDDINLASTGDPFISRPFFNTNAAVNGLDGQVIALDGLAAGEFRASTSGRLISAGPALRWNVNCCSDECSGKSSRLDLIAGYRYLQLREGFSSTEVLRPQGGNFASGTRFTLSDDIDTQNDFHGFEIGGIYLRQRGALTTEIQALAAFGEVDRLYTLNGSTNLFVPNAIDETYPGGFLVRPEDIGTYSEDEFTVLPQFRVNLSYCVRENVQLTAGYSFLYVNNVFRPGPLMSTEFDGDTLGVNPADGIVGSSQPRSGETDAFLNALSFGATYSF